MFPLADLRLDQRQLCDIQGRLFELAQAARGYDCPTFIEAFMNSDVARRMDGVFDFLQWAGEEYLLEELDDEVGGLPVPELPGAGTHVLDRLPVPFVALSHRRDESRHLRHRRCRHHGGAYLGMHVLDPELAIENLKELAAQRP